MAATVIACCLIGGALATAAADAKTVTIEVVPAGERIVTKTGSLVCHARKSDRTPDLSCYFGTLTKPIANSYQFQISDRGLTIRKISEGFKYSQTQPEPAGRGALWAGRKLDAPTFGMTSNQEYVAVAGSHILCDGLTSSGKYTLACGISSLAEHAYFQVGSYAVLINSYAVTLVRVTGIAKFSTLDNDIQPKVAPSAIDACLVGSWTEVGESNTFTLNGSTVALTGNGGRTLKFAADGVETVNYAHATPLVGTLDGKQLRLTTTGTVTYHDKTSGDRLTFTAVNYSDSSETATYDGQPLSLTAQTLPAPDTFTCTDSTLTERQTGYSARFTRS